MKIELLLLTNLFSFISLVFIEGSVGTGSLSRSEGLCLELIIGALTFWGFIWNFKHRNLGPDLIPKYLHLFFKYAIYFIGLINLFIIYLILGSLNNEHGPLI